MPVQGRDYDYSSQSIRCYADRLSAQVFVLEKTDWRKSIRVLALDLEDARSCADAVLQPYPKPVEDGPFGREIGKRLNRAGDVLSAAEQRRLAQILAKAAREAAANTNPASFSHFWDYKKHLEAALLKVVRKNCKLLIEAASTSDAKAKAQQEAEALRRKLKEEGATMRKEMRAALADRLRASRDRLRAIRQHIAALVPAANAQCLAHEYVEVPRLMVDASRFGEGVPSCSGIYFVWRSDRIVYVGKSSRLMTRCTLIHHAIEEGDRLSWVEYPASMLNFAQSFYIGALKPIRNFGFNAGK